MKISNGDIETLVLGVFSELRVPPGGKLHYATLVQHWKQFRFRSRDLSQALASLISSGLVRTENSSEDLVLVLSHEGHARAENNLQQGFEGLAQSLRLSWLAMQRRGPANHSRVRRPNRRLGRSTDRDSDQLKAHVEQQSRNPF